MFFIGTYQEMIWCICVGLRFRAYEGLWHVLPCFAPLYHSLACSNVRRGQKIRLFLAQPHSMSWVHKLCILCAATYHPRHHHHLPTSLVGGLKIADQYKIFRGLGMILDSIISSAVNTIPHFLRAFWTQLDFQCATWAPKAVFCFMFKATPWKMRK